MIRTKHNNTMKEVGFIKTNLLPPQYQEVEYIESTGTQYIDTGVNGNAIGTWEIKFNNLGIYAKEYEQYFAGDRSSPAAGKLFGDRANNKIYAEGRSGYFGSNLSENKIHTYKLIENNYLIDGIVMANYTPGSWGTLTYYVFSAHGEPNLCSSMRLYYLKMYSDNILIRDFIPCYRKSDNVIGLYDLVGKQFYTNQGTDTFLKGQDVKPHNIDHIMTKVNGQMKEIFEQGFTRTITGISPLTLTKCLRKPAKNYMICGKSEQDKINQLFDNTQVSWGGGNPYKGISFTKNNDGSVTLNGTCSEDFWLSASQWGPLMNTPTGHKILCKVTGDIGDLALSRHIGLSNLAKGSSIGGKAIIISPSDRNAFQIMFKTGDTFNNNKIYYQAFDLTDMYGSGNEPTIEQFEAQYPNKYYPFTNGLSPNPDYPQEIKAVGNRTRNLFDKTKVADNKAYSYNIGQPTTLSTSPNTFAYNKILEKKNNYITVSSKVSCIFRIVLLDDDYKVVSSTGYLSTPQIIDISSCTYYVLYFDKVTTPVTPDDIQIEEGSTATSYVPYGYEIPVRVRGKNLLPNNLKSTTYKGVTFTKNNDGTVSVDGTATENVELLIGSTTIIYANMVLSGCPSGGSSTKYSIVTYTYNSDGAYINSFYEYGSGVVIDTTNVAKVASYIRVRAGQSVNNLIFKPMIEEGSTATAYEPYHEPIITPIYLDRPLYNLPNEVKDKIRFSTGKRYNAIGEVVLDGSESGLSFDVTYKRASISYLNLGVYFAGQGGVYNKGISNYLTNSNTETNIGFNFGGSALFFKIDNTMTRLTEMRNWLNSHNLIICGQLATPTEESIDLPQLNLWEGTNIIEICTEIQPSEVEIIYKGK